MPDCIAPKKTRVGPESRPKSEPLDKQTGGFVSRSLIVLPDDSAKPILDAINTAKKSLRIKMFSLSETTILDALIKAHQRGVKIRVMLNPARRSGEVQNK